MWFLVCPFSFFRCPFFLSSSPDRALDRERDRSEIDELGEKTVEKRFMDEPDEDNDIRSPNPTANG